MKSIKQVPISHPTWQMLKSKIDGETHDALCRISYCIDLIGPEITFKDPMLVSIPIPNSKGNGWQMITYEISSIKDYYSICEKQEEIIQKVYEMSLSK